MKPLPKSSIEGQLYTEQQVRDRDDEWEEEVCALVYLYLALTEAMGYESSSGLSPEEWAEKIKKERDEATRQIP